MSKRTKYTKKWIASKAQKTLIDARRLQDFGKPVNPALLAKVQHVKVIRLWPMVPEAAVEPKHDGFAVYLRSTRRLIYDLEKDLDLGELTRRERFTLCHEVAHTFFYDLSDSPPRFFGEPQSVGALEELCQFAAGLLLVPTFMLQDEIKSSILKSSSLVIQLAKAFEASPEVIIRRIAQVEGAIPVYTGLVFAQTHDQDARILASYWYPLLAHLVPRPENYDRLGVALGKYLDESFWNHDNWTKSLALESGSINLTKRPYTKDRFFLEFEFVSHHASRSDSPDLSHQLV